MSLRVVPFILLALICLASSTQSLANEPCKNSKPILSAQETLDFLINARRAEITKRLDELIEIRKALEDARSTEEGVFLVSLPISLGGAVLAANGATQAAFMIKQKGMAWIALPIVAAKITAGLAITGGSIYAVSLTTKQKREWEEKLAKASEVLENRMGELNGLTQAWNIIPSKNSTCDVGRSAVSSSTQSKGPSTSQPATDLNRH